MGVQAEVSQPLVSVVLPTYNRAHSLMRAVRSVLRQTYESLELIVVDDGSTDDTEALIARLDDPRITYIRNDFNRGASAARNIGVRHARGEFLAFQDSDDEWLLEKLEMQVHAITARGEEYGATFGGKILYGLDEKGAVGPARVCFHPRGSKSIQSGDMAARIFEGNVISPQTLLLRRSACEAAGAFDERLPANVDWDFMLRLSKVTLIDFTMQPVVVAFQSQDSISGNLRWKARSFIFILKKMNPTTEQELTAYRRNLFVTASYLRRLGRFRSAEKCIRRAVSIRPHGAEAWLRLLHVRLSRYLRFFWRVRTNG